MNHLYTRTQTTLTYSNSLGRIEGQFERFRLPLPTRLLAASDRLSP